jgi:COP9 signalosome complex subunit 3
VKLVVRALPGFWVADLQKAYAAVPVQLVATWLGQALPEAERYLGSLIAEGRINAIIEGSGGSSPQSVLRFCSAESAGPVTQSEQQQYEELVRQTARTKELTRMIKEADERLNLSTEYVNYLKKNKGRPGSAEDPESMDITWDTADHDEDLMSDLR